MTAEAMRPLRLSIGQSDFAVRHDWSRSEIRDLFALPFPELMFQAQTVHRANFDPAEVQVSTLLSIKTGGCPEDCAYCPQSAKYDTGVKAEKLMSLDKVLAEAGLLARGKNRTPLAERLQDKGAYYILVTSADLAGRARD